MSINYNDPERRKRADALRKQNARKRTRDNVAVGAAVGLLVIVVLVIVYAVLIGAIWLFASQLINVIHNGPSFWPIVGMGLSGIYILRVIFSRPGTNKS